MLNGNSFINIFNLSWEVMYLQTLYNINNLEYFNNNSFYFIIINIFIIIINGIYTNCKNILSNLLNEYKLLL